MSIELRPREKGIAFLEETIDAVNLLKRANGFPVTEMKFPVNSDGVTLSFEPGVFDHNSVWLEYSAILDNPTDENVDAAVEKAREEYEAWLKQGEHEYSEVVSKEKAFFMDSKHLKREFENVGFKFIDKEYRDFFNAFKHPLQTRE